MNIQRAHDENELVSYIEGKESVVLYGAGMTGGLIKDWMVFRGYGDKIKCFVNTAVERPFDYRGLSVYGLDEVSWSDNYTVILCALSDKHEGMISELKSRGVDHVLVPEGKVISDLERSWINHMREQNSKDTMKKCDILVFSQDNNATSGAFISMVNLFEEIQHISGKYILVVLPLCGNGEELLTQKGVDYTYYYRETSWVKREDGSSENVSVVEEDEIAGLCDFIRSTGAELVHMNGAFVYAAGVAAMRIGIPTVWQLRENIMSSGFVFKNPKEAYEMMNSSDGVICVSRHVHKEYTGLDPQKVSIIYNGADDAVFYKKRKILDDPTIKIVMVGHITKLKGQDTLVRALDILKRNGEAVPRVTFVGSSQYDYIEELKDYIADRGLSDYVAFAGMTSVPEKYYHDADIAVSATVGGEGFDRVRIESMLSGCLLIANDAGAAREIVFDRETGYLYESGNAESLADAIKKAIDDVDVSRKIAENGQELCLKKFTKDCNAKQIVSFYEGILNRKTVFDVINDGGNVCIYGAGTMGRALKKCLTENPYNACVSNYIVRNLADNADVVDGVRVIDIEHAELYKDLLILVALNGKLMPEAISDLEAAGLSNIVPVSFDGDLWTDIRKKWIRANGILPDDMIFLADNMDGKADAGPEPDRFHIYVAHSVYDRELSKNPVIDDHEIPIQVGAALTDKHIFSVLDSTGNDNISGKNRQYCELTGIYWAWKNDESDLIGFCHYRRKFLLTDEQIQAVIEDDIDVVVTYPILNFDSVRSQYGKDHVIEDWDIFMSVIEKMAPAYIDAARQVQNGIYYYAYNMFIMKRNLFDDYCSFIFPILKECERRIGQKDDIYQNRYIGFLAERLLSVYLTKNRHLKVAIAEKTFYE